MLPMCFCMAKSSNYRIRVEPALHHECLGVCPSEDRPAVPVIREFMKDHVGRYQSTRQSELFVEENRGRYDAGEK